MTIKGVKITITVTEEFAVHIKTLAAARVAPKVTVLPPGPPVSQAEWLAKTPEGRQFAQDCMKFKYARLNHKQLMRTAKTLYYKTYDVKERQSNVRVYTPEMSIVYVQNKMLVDALMEGLAFRTETSINS